MDQNLDTNKEQDAADTENISQENDKLENGLNSQNEDAATSGKVQADYEHLYKKSLADYQNLLKRTAKEKEEFIKYANEQLIHAIIPVYDNLKMSLNHTDSQIEKSSWLEGVKFVLKQFKDILEGIGVEEIKTVGEKFDHHSMEALGGNGEMVASEAKPGYRLNGKVIIPARVVLENS